MSKLKICLVGMPSSGKSSIINSLVGRRVIQTGISRTTIEKKLYENLESDDNIMFDIYDLPGISDVEDKNKQYENLMYDTIGECNLVIWVSDKIKAFTTRQEIECFEDVIKHMQKLAINHGLPTQIIIMLSKFDEYFDTSQLINKQNKHTQTEKVDNISEKYPKIVDDEIYGDEDTTILDNLINIKNNIKNIDVICFNAHGRSYHGTKSSDNLKNFVKRYNPSTYNTSFNLKKYKDLMPLISDQTKMSYFIETVFKPIIKEYADRIDKINKIGQDGYVKQFHCSVMHNEYDGIVFFCLQKKCPFYECNYLDCSTCSIGDFEIRCLNHPGEIIIKNNTDVRCRVGCKLNTPICFTKNLKCEHGKHIIECVKNPIINNMCDKQPLQKQYALYCASTKPKIRAESCKKDDCPTCSNNKYYIGCNKHSKAILITSNGTNITENYYNFTYYNNTYVNKCSYGCNISNKMHHVGDKIKCDHGNNLKTCPYKNTKYFDISVDIEKKKQLIKAHLSMVKNFKNVGNVLNQSYEEINSDIVKCEIINILLNEKTDFKHNIDSDVYEKLLNILCSYVIINIPGKYNIESSDANQIYRIIKIANNMNISQKIRLYVSENCKDLEIFPGLFFRKENIYNINNIKQMFSLVPDHTMLYNILDYHNSLQVNKESYDVPELNFLIRENNANYKYSVEIYSKNIIKEVKRMRLEVFGEIDNEIEGIMIPTAYDKYGLFWEPK